MRVVVLTPIKYARERHEVGAEIEMDEVVARLALRDGLVKRREHVIPEVQVPDVSDAPVPPLPKAKSKSAKKRTGVRGDAKA